MNRYHQATRRSQNDDGFVALMAVIVLGGLLAAAVARASLTGWQSRTRAINTEAHAQARALADGCANLALTTMLVDPTYDGDTSDVSAAGTCRVLLVRRDTPSLGETTILIQGIVRGFYADVRIVVLSPVTCAASAPLSSGLRIESWYEVPSHE